jgi:hypothetical protein
LSDKCSRLTRLNQNRVTSHVNLEALQHTVTRVNRTERHLNRLYSEPAAGRLQTRLRALHAAPLSWDRPPSYIAIFKLAPSNKYGHQTKPQPIRIEHWPRCCPISLREPETGSQRNGIRDKTETPAGAQHQVQDYRSSQRANIIIDDFRHLQNEGPLL